MIISLTASKISILNYSLILVLTKYALSYQLMLIIYVLGSKRNIVVGICEYVPTWNQKCLVVYSPYALLMQLHCSFAALETLRQLVYLHFKKISCLNRSWVTQFNYHCQLLLLIDKKVNHKAHIWWYKHLVNIACQQLLSRLWTCHQIKIIKYQI